MKTRDSGYPFSFSPFCVRSWRQGSSIFHTILAWALRLGASVFPAACAIAQPGSVDLTFDPGLGPDGEVKALGIQSNGKIVIGGVFTHVYLEYSDVLASGNWLPLPTIAGNGAIRILTDTSSTRAQRFYRVRVE